MNTNHLNNAFPKLFGEAIDSLFNTNLSDIIGMDYSKSIPSVNVREQDGHFEIEMAAPGMSKKEFNISIEKDQLIISSNKKEATEEEHKEESQNYKRREFNFGTFERKFLLPETVDRNKVSAQYKNGILYVKVEKLEAAKDKGPIQIKIS